MVWTTVRRCPQLMDVRSLVLPLNKFPSRLPTFAVRETDVSRHNGGTSGAPLKPLGDDSALSATPQNCHLLTVASLSAMRVPSRFSRAPGGVLI